MFSAIGRFGKLYVISKRDSFARPIQKLRTLSSPRLQKEFFLKNRSEPVQKWLQSVPKLLTNLKSLPDAGKGSKVIEVTLKVIQMVGVQGHQAFLDSLQENGEDLLGRNS